MANISMLTFTGQLEDILQDTDNDCWSVDNLLGWYNRAARLTVIKAPYANTKIEALKLAPGVKQEIPAAGISVLKVIRNMGTDGQTPGEAVTPSLVKLIQAFDRNWITVTATAAIKNWMPETDRVWFCYPPSDGTAYAEVEYSEVPNPVIYDVGGDWENAMVGVSEKYVDAVFNLVLAWAFSKDTDHPGSDQRALKHYNLFLEGVGAPPINQMPVSGQGAA